MSQALHIANRESKYKVVSIAPDFCEVDGHIIPFDISQDLVPEKAGYAKRVFARGQAVLPVDSVINGVVGDGGSGIISGTSLHHADIQLIEGAEKILVEGRPVCRHGSLALMNLITGT